jgi:hypothetical protein
LSQAATGCVEPAGSRLGHLTVIKTFADAERLLAKELDRVRIGSWPAQRRSLFGAQSAH